MLRRGFIRVLRLQKRFVRVYRVLQVFYGLIELALKAPQGDFVRGTLGSSIMIPWLRSGV